MITQILTNMLTLHGGCFEMGHGAGQTPSCPAENECTRTVDLSTFLLGRYPVTQQIWEAVMGYNPSFCPACPDCPVENVSWDDVQVFLGKLNQQSGYAFRLPSEAEWEYAACAGNNAAAFRFSGSDCIDEVAWYSGNAGRGTHPVGTKRPNAAGFFDLSGNVSEWCADLFVLENPPIHKRYRDPGGYLETLRSIAVDRQTYRVLRGGGWGTQVESCRIAFRGGLPQQMRHPEVGFRLALAQ